jgi:hypothetical protein
MVELVKLLPRAKMHLERERVLPINQAPFSAWARVIGKKNPLRLKDKT